MTMQVLIIIQKILPAGQGSMLQSSISGSMTAIVRYLYPPPQVLLQSVHLDHPTGFGPSAATNNQCNIYSSTNKQI